jgi:hypothetical protein
MDGDLRYSPPATAVDGLIAVPIDIERLEARVVFDLAARSAQAEATMLFRAGSQDGHPMFDMRQGVWQAWLDGTTLPPGSLRHHDLGGGRGAEMRVLERELPAGSRHTLRVAYAMEEPQSPQAQPVGWDPAAPRMTWDFWFTDLLPARYLEMWFPANLVFDRFPFSLEIELASTEIEHALITNGRVDEEERNCWRIQFPGSFTALSPLLVLAPADEVEIRYGMAALPEPGAAVQLVTAKPSTAGESLAEAEDQVASYLAGNAARIGPYLHGNRFTTFLWPGSRSMEYDGGTTSNMHALEHETFHSWFGRGVKPASQNDGWIDEGWTTYNTGPRRFARLPFEASEPRVELCSSNPFNRATPAASYGAGARFFAGLAAAMGLDELLAMMCSFYLDNMCGLVTTRQLEEWLIAKSGREEIGRWFARFVYGIEPG